MKPGAAALGRCTRCDDWRLSVGMVRPAQGGPIVRVQQPRSRCQHRPSTGSPGQERSLPSGSCRESLESTLAPGIGIAECGLPADGTRVQSVLLADRLNAPFCRKSAQRRMPGIEAEPHPGRSPSVKNPPELGRLRISSVADVAAASPSAPDPHHVAPRRCSTPPLLRSGAAARPRCRCRRVSQDTARLVPSHVSGSSGPGPDRPALAAAAGPDCSAFPCRAIRKLDPSSEARTPSIRRAPSRWASAVA